MLLGNPRTMFKHTFYYTKEPTLFNACLLLWIDSKNLTRMFSFPTGYHYEAGSVLTYIKTYLKNKMKFSEKKYCVECNHTNYVSLFIRS